MEQKPSPRDGAPSFTDVPTTHSFFTPITWMAGEGISNGYPDGTFQPTVVVNRQQMSAFVQNWKT
jgi:hypothetical protein